MNFAKQSGHNGSRVEKNTPRKSVSNTPNNNKSPDTNGTHTRHMSAAQQKDLINRLYAPKQADAAEPAAKLGVPRSTTIQRKSLGNGSTPPQRHSRTNSVSHTPATPKSRIAQHTAHSNSIVSPSRIPVLSPVDVQRSTTLHSSRSSVHYEASTPTNAARSHIPRLSTANVPVADAVSSDNGVLRDRSNTPPRHTPPSKNKVLSNSNSQTASRDSLGVAPIELNTASSAPVAAVNAADTSAPAVTGTNKASDATVTESKSPAPAAQPVTSSVAAVTAAAQPTAEAVAAAAAAANDPHLHADLDKYDVDLSLDDDTDSVHTTEPQQIPAYDRKNSVELLRQKFELPKSNAAPTQATDISAAELPAHSTAGAESCVPAAGVPAVNEPLTDAKTSSAAPASTASAEPAAPAHAAQSELPSHPVPHKRAASTSSIDLGLDDVSDTDELLDLSSPAPNTATLLATPAAEQAVQPAVQQAPESAAPLDLLSDDEHRAVEHHIAGLDSTINSPLASMHNTQNMTQAAASLTSPANTAVIDSDSAAAPEQTAASGATAHTTSNTDSTADAATHNNIAPAAIATDNHVAHTAADTKPDTADYAAQQHDYQVATSPSGSGNPLSNISNYMSPADSQHHTALSPNAQSTAAHTAKQDSIDLGFDGMDSPLNDDAVEVRNTQLNQAVTPALVQQLVNNTNHLSTPTHNTIHVNTNAAADPADDAEHRKISNSIADLRNSVSQITNVKTPPPQSTTYNKQLSKFMLGVEMLKIPRQGSAVKCVQVKLVQGANSKYHIQWHSATKQNADDTQLCVNDCVLVLGQSAGLFAKDKWRAKYESADTRSFSILHLKRSLDLMMLDQIMYDNVASVLRALPFKNIEGK